MKIKIDFLGKEHEVDIHEAHMIRRLGYPTDYELSEEVSESIEEMYHWYVKHGEPWIYIYELEVGFGDDNLYLDGIKMTAPKVYKRFVKNDVSKAMLILSTAGEKLDVEVKRLWENDFPDKSFFLDILGACITESLVTFGVDTIRAWAQKKGKGSLARYSPGYPGWNVSEQIVLMGILSNKNMENPVTVLDTALLTPLKSQLSLIGITNSDTENKDIEMECMTCSFASCSCKRK